MRKVANAGSQRGVFLVTAVIMAVVLIMMFAFAIDIGRLLLSARTLRVAAESAALAGVQRLKKCDITIPKSTPLDFDCTPYSATATGIGGWRAVKPAVISVLQLMNIGSYKAGPITFSSNPSRCDINDTIDGFGNLQYIQGSDGGNISVKVERLFECDNGGSITLISLEADSYVRNLPDKYHYCYANAVRVTLTYNNFQPILARIIGASASRSITRDAVARLHPTTGALMCSFPSCNLIYASGTQCSPDC